MTEKSQDHAIVLTVDHRFKRGNGKEKTIKDDTEIVDVRKFETTPAVVRRGYGMTMNLGNFESARIDISIEVPCYVEDVHLADKWAAEFVEERIKAVVRNVKSKKSGQKSPI